jgi:riboflavin synthase
MWFDLDLIPRLLLWPIGLTLRSSLIDRPIRNLSPSIRLPYGFIQALPPSLCDEVLVLGWEGKAENDSVRNTDRVSIPKVN